MHLFIPYMQECLGFLRCWALSTSGLPRALVDCFEHVAGDVYMYINMYIYVYVYIYPEMMFFYKDKYIVRINNKYKCNNNN